jgi:hypothetical protein
MNGRRRYGNRVERAIDASVIGILVVVAIHSPNDFTRAAALIGAALLLLAGSWLGGAVAKAVPVPGGALARRNTVAIGATLLLPL